MFIADFHLNGNPLLMKPITKILKREEVDIYLLGGDYQVNAFGNYPVVKSLYTELLKVIDTSKVYAILGNHDEYKIAEMLDELGVNMLLNEYVTFNRGEQSLTITGIDDSDKYLAHEFPELPKQHRDYRILLTHSPNIYKDAQRKGYDLLLAGTYSTLVKSVILGELLSYDLPNFLANIPTPLGNIRVCKVILHQELVILG